MNNTLRAYSALVKREIWEHRSYWIVPVVVGCLLIFCVLIVFGVLPAHMHHGVINITSDTATAGVDAAMDVRIFIFLWAIVFDIVMLFMVWFYLMDSLYADRKDRSVLFWKSMPVSDTSTVLSKLFTGMVTAPALMLTAVIATEIVIGILLICVFALKGVNLLPLAFQPGTIVLAWITLAFALIVQSLWLVPFFGWFLLCSAWAKKLVLGWVVLIPVGAMIVEYLFIGTHYLFSAIIGHPIRLVRDVIADAYLSNGGSIGSGMMIGDKSDAGSTHAVLMSLSSLARIFAQPELWIGIAIGAIFIFGAIWLRRNRSEI